MNIQPNYYNNISMTGAKPDPTWRSRFKQKFLDLLPEATIKSHPDKVAKWNKNNTIISHPVTNRLIMGATALVTQPAIDYYNHRVDKETREVSRNRTIAKILAGTSVGILVRGTCAELVDRMTDMHTRGKAVKKHSRALIPKQQYKSFLKKEKFLKNHRNALANTLAAVVMSITNFVFDAPLTVWLTNKFNTKTQLKYSKEVKNG